MYRLSLIISEIYNKYLPLAQKDGISLNLDFSDTTKEISDPEQIKKYLDEHLDSALKRSDKGEVTINVDKTAITITDTGTTLSKAACALLSNRFIDVKSRVGFGTSVKIYFQAQATPDTTHKLEVEGAGFSVDTDTTQPNPIIESTGKVALKQGKHKARLGAKLRLQRKNDDLTTAAKKADKAVKRIAKKATKSKKTVNNSQKKRLAKPSKTLKTPTKTKKSTRKLEVS